jgi:hypothetical protein
LVLGKTEMPLVSAANLFQVTDPRLHIYAKVVEEGP